MRIFERTVGPLLLILLTPPLTLVLWTIVTMYDGSAMAFARDLPAHHVYRALPLPSVWASGVFAAWTAFQWALLRGLPAKPHLGPLTPRGARPEYRENGVGAWAVTHVVLLVGFATGLFSATTFFERFGELLATLSLGAFVFCAFLYAKALIKPNSPDRVRTGNPVYDFFMGIELHPRVGGTSVKQLVNCRVSMMGWSALVVAFCAYQVEATGTLTPALAASSIILVAYLFKFFVWETGYFASLDIMHDRFGFYISWGVLAWVPAVYPIAQLYLAAHPTGLPWWGAVLIVLFGLAMLVANYAADAQRQRVRQTNGRCHVWGKPPSVIRAEYRTEDGHVRHNLLLTSGFWGIARHFHYIPEILTALAWTIPVGLHSAAAYFYVAFLTVLLFHRAYRDDERCAAKYGDAWEEYRRGVPYRIVPGVY